MATTKIAHFVERCMYCSPCEHELGSQAHERIKNERQPLIRKCSAGLPAAIKGGGLHVIGQRIFLRGTAAGYMESTLVVEHNEGVASGARRSYCAGWVLPKG